MLLFFMTLVYLYFHGTTVQGSSVGVSCRLFLLRLYFAQTHSSLAIAPRPESTKLEKKLKLYYLWRLKNPLFSGLQSFNFVELFPYHMILSFLRMFENDRKSWVSFNLLNFRWYTRRSFLEFANMVWFWKGQRCKCKDAPSNWLNLPLDIHVCGRWFIISSVVIIIFIIIAFR